jgi:hypothetical protein
MVIPTQKRLIFGNYTRISRRVPELCKLGDQSTVALIFTEYSIAEDLRRYYWIRCFQAIALHEQSLDASLAVTQSDQMHSH